MNWNTGQMSAVGENATDRAQSFADDVKSAAADMRSRALDAVGRGADWASKKAGDLLVGRLRS